MVHTTVRPVSTVFLTVRITIAAARASRPLVGSSMKMMEGLATSSTAMVSRFRCSVERPLTPCKPTSACSSSCSSTSSITSSTNCWRHHSRAHSLGHPDFAECALRRGDRKCLRLPCEFERFRRATVAMPRRGVTL